METKVNEFLREFIYYHYNDEEIVLHRKIDNRNLDAQEWLHAISVDGYKQYKEWDWTYRKKQRRALKKLSKIVKNARIESGYMLISVFMNIAAVRDNIITEVIDGKEMDDFSSNPYDYDYDISPDAIQKALQEADSENTNPKRTVFLVTTRDTAGHPVTCPNCEGKGFLRCEECGGSGREQYADGNYASGEERIKTGQCYNCYGTGKLQCDECMGSGKRQIFSNQYQIVRSFKDIKKMRGYICLSSSFDGFSCSDFPIMDPELGPGFLCGCRSWDAKVWLSFENQELKSGIVKLYKNQKEILIDRNQTLPNELGEDYKHLYEQNKSKALEHFNSSEEVRQGKLACSVEKHLAIPLYRITFIDPLFSDYEKKGKIDLYEQDGKVRCCFDVLQIPELGFFKSLFV